MTLTGAGREFEAQARLIVRQMGTVGARSVAVELFDPVPSLDLYAVWRAESGEHNPAVKAFLDSLDAGPAVTSTRT